MKELRNSTKNHWW